MINLRNIFVLLVLSSMFFYSCKDENNPSDPGNTPTNEGYFPNADGNYYNYEIERTDSAGTGTVGQRITRYSGTQILGNTTYQRQIDSLIFVAQTTPSTSYFRKSQNNQVNGVFYFLDTAGLSEIIPDTLMQYITLDNEFRFMKFPFTAGDNWPVFKMSFSYLGLITITLVEVTAFYEANEDLTLNLSSGQIVKSSARVKYQLTLKIPDPANPFLPPKTAQYNAYGWFVENIGPAKWEGNAAVLNAFAGGVIDLDDTSSTVTQNLKEYSIK